MSFMKISFYFSNQLFTPQETHSSLYIISVTHISHCIVIICLYYLSPSLNIYFTFSATNYASAWVMDAQQILVEFVKNSGFGAFPTIPCWPKSIQSFKSYFSRISFKKHVFVTLIYSTEVLYFIIINLKIDSPTVIVLIFQGNRINKQQLFITKKYSFKN